MPIVKILLWKYHKHDDWFRDLVARAIVYFTGYDYTHVAVQLLANTYDSTVWRDKKGKLRSGIRVTSGLPDDPLPYIALVPRSEIIPTDIIPRMGDTIRCYLKADRPYNIFKLLVLAVVWPTRWFWKKINWVPFDHEVFGEVCSVFIDEVFYKSRWDLFPEDREGYTVPGQFLRLLNRDWEMEDIY